MKKKNEFEVLCKKIVQEMKKNSSFEKLLENEETRKLLTDKNLTSAFKK